MDAETREHLAEWAAYTKMSVERGVYVSELHGRLCALVEHLRWDQPRRRSVAAFVDSLWDESSWPDGPPRETVSRETFRRWHSATEPPAWYIAMICERFDVSPEWLLLGRGMP